MIHEELRGKIIGMETRIAREKLANTTRLIFMPEPYPCYPFNPWFFETLKIVVSLAQKNDVAVRRRQRLG